MELEPIIWSVLGILLILAEFIVPGLVIIFFGTSALVVGIALWMGMPTGGGLPFIIFAGLAVLQILILRRFFKPWFAGQSLGTEITGEGVEELIGKKVPRVSGFESGSLEGIVSFKGADWSARSEKAPDNCQSFIITGREGLTLIVKPCN